MKRIETMDVTEESMTRRIRSGTTRACALGLLVLAHDVDAMDLEENVVDIVETDLPCQWSPVIAIGDGCTAAYVGNRMVVTAAHCLGNVQTSGEAIPTKFTFTDSDFSSDDVPRFELTAERCRVHPQYDLDPDEFDIGWCYLSEEPPLVAAIPVMVPDRCESVWISRQVLGAAPQPLRVTAVGMGCHVTFSPPNEFCPDRGRKRYTSYEIRSAPEAGRLEPEWVSWDPDVATVRTGGDSGGPVYVRLPDGTWRLVAVHSTGQGLSEYDIPAPPFLAWIEKSSGVDITPCHELDESDQNWGRYVFIDDQNCSSAHSVDPLPTAVDDVDWTDGCSTPVSGPDPALVNECAHWPVASNYLRSPLP